MDAKFNLLALHKINELKNLSAVILTEQNIQPNLVFRQEETPMAQSKTAMIDGLHPGLCLQSTVLKAMEIPVDWDNMLANKHSHSVKNLGTSKSPFSLFEQRKQSNIPR